MTWGVATPPRPGDDDACGNGGDAPLSPLLPPRPELDSSPNMPSVEVTQSSHPIAIVEWAARACADEVSEYAHEILAYWDANASPRERTLCWEKNAGPPLSSRLSISERLLANAQSEVRRAQWVCTYLAMSVSPSHPQHHKGGSQGPIAPSPAAHWVSRPSSSMAQTPTPAHLTKTAPQQRLQRAAIVLQCWKWRIWLRRWFNQQALLKQKRLHLQTLCRGASTYASSVQGNRHPPLTPTRKSSDPKVLNHPFRTRGQLLPPRKMRRPHKISRRRPGRSHWPRAPNSGGGASCMPLIFWATQTLAASDLFGVGDCGSTFTP